MFCALYVYNIQFNKCVFYYNRKFKNKNNIFKKQLSLYMFTKMSVAKWIFHFTQQSVQSPINVDTKSVQYSESFKEQIKNNFLKTKYVV